MKRNADATRQRILAAARREFAERGLAGSRVNRIAAEAKANKQLIYQYFVNKESLFDTVFDIAVKEYIDAVNCTADRLVEYTVKTFEYIRDNPDVMRLSLWHKLERELLVGPHPVVVASGDIKADAVGQAQRDGRIGPAFDAHELLLLATALTTLAVHQPLQFGKKIVVSPETIARALSMLIAIPGDGARALSASEPAHCEVPVSLALAK